MLVLSRAENEGIVLGRSRLVTVARIMHNAVGIVVREFDGAERPLLLARHESAEVGLGARITLVEIGDIKARLGIEAPKELSVMRKEVWDAVNQ
jgi:sRNA-binding carbon storage regulator CsrA